MKFELKTENENNLRSFSYVFKTVVNLALIIIFLDVSLKLGTISKQYKIDSATKKILPFNPSP